MKPNPTKSHEIQLRFNTLLGDDLDRGLYFIV